MSRRVLGEAEVSDGQKVRTLNVILLLLIIGSTIIGISYTLGTAWVALSVLIGGGATTIVITNIIFLNKK